MGILQGILKAIGFMSNLFNFWKDKKQDAIEDEAADRRAHDAAETEATLTEMEAEKNAEEARNNPNKDFTTW